MHPRAVIKISRISARFSKQIPDVPHHPVIRKEKTTTKVLRCLGQIKWLNDCLVPDIKKSYHTDMISVESRFSPQMVFTSPFLHTTCGHTPWKKTNVVTGSCWSSTCESLPLMQRAKVECWGNGINLWVQTQSCRALTLRADCFFKVRSQW